MSDLIRRKDALYQIWDWVTKREYEHTNATYWLQKRIEAIPSADRPQDDCTTCEHYNDVGDWCKTCGVSHYTPRMKGADDEMR